MNTWVVVPTYNERANIGTIVTRLFSLFPGIHVLVVDDNSPDGTGKIADELAAKEPRIHVLHRARKEGLGRASARAVQPSSDAACARIPQGLPGVFL